MPKSSRPSKQMWIGSSSSVVPDVSQRGFDADHFQSGHESLYRNAQAGGVGEVPDHVDAVLREFVSYLPSICSRKRMQDIGSGLRRGRQHPLQKGHGVRRAVECRWMSRSPFVASKVGLPHLARERDSNGPARRLDPVRRDLVIGSKPSREGLAAEHGQPVRMARLPRGREQVGANEFQRRIFGSLPEEPEDFLPAQVVFRPTVTREPLEQLKLSGWCQPVGQ